MPQHDRAPPNRPACFFCDNEQEVTFAVTTKKDAELALCKFHAQMLYKGLAQYSSGKYHGDNQIVFL